MSVAAARPIRTYVDLCVRTYARYTYLVAVDRLTDTIDIQTAVTHRYRSINWNIIQEKVAEVMELPVSNRQVTDDSVEDASLLAVGRALVVIR